MASLAEKAIQRLGGRYVGLHLRRGDKLRMMPGLEDSLGWGPDAEGLEDGASLDVELLALRNCFGCGMMWPFFVGPREEATSPENLVNFLLPGQP